MACMKLGYKPDTFRLDGQSCHCLTGLPSDVVVEVGEISFHLHKFPLLSRSGLLENLIEELSWDDEKKSVLQLHDVPGGARAFLVVAKFCYGVKIEINASNIVSLRCAAEYLQMTEEYSEGNLITQTENFLYEIFSNWSDSIKALKTCEEVLSHAEELYIVSRCIDSLAKKACSDQSLFNWPVSGRSSVQSTVGTTFWNGIPACTNKPLLVGEDWWYEDVSSLGLPLYKRLIQVVESRGMRPKRIAGSLIHYAKQHLSLLGSQSSFHNGKLANMKQRNLLEEIVELLPNEKGVTPTNFLMKLLRTSIVLHTSSSCQDKLEKWVGAQLDQAVLEDLLIPNTGYSTETLYDIDCVQRIVDYFLFMDRDKPDSASNLLADEDSLNPITKVANLVDAYLVEVAPDVNLKSSKIQSLVSVIPEYVRSLDDGIYRAIDIYFKAHPWLIDSEREQICRLINFQKLSLEAFTHAAQNERLPLRAVVQILVLEQLRLRNSISGWLFVSDNLENSQNDSANPALARNEASIQAGNVSEQFVAVENMKKKVAELEKEYLNMKEEIEKLAKTKGGWSAVLKKLGLKLKAKSFEEKISNTCDDTNELPLSTAPLMN